MVSIIKFLFLVSFFFFLMIRRPPRSTLFPLHDALPISCDFPPRSPPCPQGGTAAPDHPYRTPHVGNRESQPASLRQRDPGTKKDRRRHDLASDKRDLLAPAGGGEKPIEAHRQGRGPVCPNGHLHGRLGGQTQLRRQRRAGWRPS